MTVLGFAATTYFSVMRNSHNPLPGPLAWKIVEAFMLRVCEATEGAGWPQKVQFVKDEGTEYWRKIQVPGHVRSVFIMRNKSLQGCRDCVADVS